MPNARPVATALLAAVLALGGACGGGEEKEVQSGAGATGPAGGAGDDPTVTSPAGDKPEVTVPDGEPPTELVITDLKVGDGAEAADGKTVKVHYVGVLFSDGKQFDASWDRGDPFSFRLPGQVIKGWNQGVPGMKVGGRRQLVIPAELAYGPAGRPPVIPGGAALVFVIDLLEVS